MEAEGKVVNITDTSAGTRTGTGIGNGKEEDTGDGESEEWLGFDAHSETGSGNGSVNGRGILEGVGFGDAGMIFPKKVTYRATHPVYVGERYRICMDEEDMEGVSEVRIVDGYGNVSMVGRIERF